MTEEIKTPIKRQWVFGAHGNLHQVLYYKPTKYAKGILSLTILSPSDQSEGFGYVPPMEITYHTEEAIEKLVCDLTDALDAAKKVREQCDPNLPK